MERADFHVHLGDRDPHNLIDEAVVTNTRAIGIMDRGTVITDKLATVINAGHTRGITVLPGVESLTQYKDATFELIGLDFKLNHPEIVRVFDPQGEVSVQKHCQKVTHQSRFLDAEGFKLEKNKETEAQWDAIDNRALDTAYRLCRIASLTPGNADLISEMRNGIAAHLETRPQDSSDAVAKFLYWKYFAIGAPGFKQWFVDYKTIIDAVHQASGIVAIAHPKFAHVKTDRGITDYIPELFEKGVDGLEGWYSSLNNDQLDTELASLALYHNKLVLGGSGRDITYDNTRIGTGHVEHPDMFIPASKLDEIQQYKKIHLNTFSTVA